MPRISGASRIQFRTRAHRQPPDRYQKEDASESFLDARVQERDARVQISDVAGQKSDARVQFQDAVVQIRDASVQFSDASESFSDARVQKPVARVRNLDGWRLVRVGGSPGRYASGAIASGQAAAWLAGPGSRSAGRDG